MLFLSVARGKIPDVFKIVDGKQNFRMENPSRFKLGPQIDIGYHS